MRLLTPLILLTTLVSCNRTDISDKNDAKQKPLTDYSYTYIDTESRFTDSTGLDVIIQNSLPKGVGITTGKRFDRIFWNRIINESPIPIELTINFPADSLPISTSDDSYIRVFMPIDTMTVDKESMYAFGLTSGLDRRTPLQTIINPKEESLFYIGVVFDGGGGVARGQLFLKGYELFYNIRGISPKLDSTLIPCGQIDFEKI